jgi:cell division protein FtsZ
MLQLEEERTSPTNIKVVGVGGGGMNAVSRMIDAEMHGVQFMVLNTDEQVLKKSQADDKIQIGNRTTRGMGAGGDPDMGHKAAMEDRDKILQKLKGADMVFITAGMGGGTGTGAAPVVAEVAKEMGALTVGVVTLPFAMEGGRRMDYALRGIEALKEKVDTLITIKNDSIFKVIDRNTSVDVAFRLVDDILLNAVKGISDLINTAGLVNVDFADVRSIMGETGDAIVGAGEGVGENRISDAVNQAINNVLLEDTSIEGATALLINVCGGEDMSITDWKEVSELITSQVDPDANIIIGLTLDDKLQDQIHVTVLATGFRKKQGLRQKEVQSRYRQEKMAAGGEGRKPWKNYSSEVAEPSIEKESAPVVSIRQTPQFSPRDDRQSRQHMESRSEPRQGYRDDAGIIPGGSADIEHMGYEHEEALDGYYEYRTDRLNPQQNTYKEERYRQGPAPRNERGYGNFRDRDMDNLDIPAFLRRKKEE